MMSRKHKKRRKYITFKQILPNMITSGNILTGVLSLVLAWHGHILPAAWLVPVAGIFDFMDGKVARALGGSSSFGVELDSLADVVSFGVVPAMIFYSAYMKGFLGVAGALVIAFYVLCGALRLARFNVTSFCSAFQGLPIPAAGTFLAAFVVAGYTLPPLVAAVIAFCTGALMISNLRYSNFKMLHARNLSKAKASALAILLAILFVVFRSAMPLAAISLYVASGLVGFDWGKWLITDNDEATEEI